MTFQEILYRRRIPFRQSASDRNEIHLNCPFCPERRGERDYNFCLHINVLNGAGHCWHASCDFKGRHILFLVLRKLSIQTDELTSGGDVEETPPEPVTLPRDFQLLTKAYDNLDRQALNYLLKRGITREQIAENKIGVSYSGNLAYRIIFPVLVGKELKGIVARDFTGNQQPKYLNSKGDKYLYHFDPKAEVCILSEGVFKALRIARVTGANSAALLGHDLTPVQLDQLQKSSCRRLILWPDPDLVGRKGVLGIIEKLSDLWDGTLEVVWPIRTPADEMTLEDLGTSLNHIEINSWSLHQKVLLNNI